MDTIQYIPIDKNFSGKSYVFQVEMTQRGDGDWIAWIATLPGCAAWGFSKDEALAMLTQTARAYVRMLRDQGEQMPDNVTTHHAPIVAVTI